MIKRVSNKRAKQLRLYNKQRKRILEDNNECKAKLPMCTNIATTIHHIAGRMGDRLNDEDNMIPLCMPCHEWVETHPKEAKQLGLSKSRIV